MIGGGRWPGRTTWTRMFWTVEALPSVHPPEDTLATTERVPVVE